MKGMDFIMKKLLALALVSVLTLSMAGCGEKNDIMDSPAQVDENGNVIAGTAIEGAGKEVDLDKVEGDKLTAVESDAQSKAKLDDYDVSIEDAKIFEFEGQKKLAVTFTFKNKSETPVAFDNVMVVDVRQGGKELVGGKVVMGVPGINILSGVEMIEKGTETTVQRTFDVLNEEAVTVTVYEYSGDAAITKTFNVK